MMNESDEYKVVKEIEDISRDISRLKKKNYFLAFVFAAIGACMVSYVLLTVGLRISLWPNFLSFVAGGAFVWSYIKFAEVHGFILISKYLDSEKIQKMKESHEANGVLSTERSDSARKAVINIAVWAAIAYMVMHALKYFKIV